ncbi:hypothetical protein L596_015948 [Steinernema carpocapsae]|uniref:Piwi domain-containing protein n=1 Tax=Steinernema carpocapsae TaxID=34508 RepID=A0A4U5NHB6_STECR|nr:hypothetical protein L596_015948 [Steinernema carpocapsae]
MHAHRLQQLTDGINRNLNDEGIARRTPMSPTPSVGRHDKEITLTSNRAPFGPWEGSRVPLYDQTQRLHRKDRGGPWRLWKSKPGLKAPPRRRLMKRNGFRDHDFFCDLAGMRLYTIKPIPRSEGNPRFYVSEATKDGNFAVCRDDGRPFELNIRDVFKEVRIPNLQDATLDAFINTAINKACLAKSDLYFPIFETCYPKTGAPVARKDGRSLILGTKTSVERVEGRYGSSTTPVVALNVSAEWFYMKKNLLDFCKQNIELNEKSVPVDAASFQLLSDSMQGVTVRLICSKNPLLFTIKSLANKNVSMLKYPLPNIKGTGLIKFLWETYSVRLTYPESFAAEVKPDFHVTDPRPIFYPVELLEIMPMQRALKGKKSCDGSAVDREKKIQEKVHQMERHVQKAGLGLSMDDAPVEVEAGVLDLPKIVFADEKVVEVNPSSASWRFGSGECPERFARPAEVKELPWCVMLVSDVPPTKGMSKKAKFFADLLKKQAAERGLQMKEPMYHPTKQGKVEIERFFNTTAVEFFVFLMAKSLDYHDFTKILERKYQVITQTVKMENAFDVVEDPNSTKSRKIVEHIVMKMNLKLGGVNSTVKPSRHLFSHEEVRRLLIGFTLIEGPKITGRDAAAFNRFGGKIPAVVGFSANMGSLEHEFLGDFTFQYLDHTNIVQDIKKIVATILERFRKTRRGRDPAEVVIYRKLDEFHFPRVIQNEIAPLKNLLEEKCHGFVSLIYIAMTKTHNIRFFPKGPPPEGDERKPNLVPGTVIDSGAVGGGLKQFFIASYSASTGTTRPPRFTILENSKEAKIRDLEKLTLELTFAHQTSTRSLGVPAPLVVAKNYARRGNVLAQRRSAMWTRRSASRR